MAQSAMQIAVALLARRDHSRQEIRNKLLAKNFEQADIDRVLDSCEANGYLDDARFAALLLRSHIAKGHGKSRIQQTLMQKGVAKEVATGVIDASDCDWFELARAKAVKKYGSKPVADIKDRARRTRFLLAQGFSYDQVAFALDYDPYDDPA